ncbi:MAG TPA: hypothetical protein VFA51_12355 [Candidatus Udaeobacter sp.]|nr:hypothetical protein [Candidatus Udaeobacter sp.]
MKNQPKKSRLRAAMLHRRRVRLIFGAALVGAIVFAAMMIRSSLAIRLTEADRAMLRQYDSIRVALSQENLTSVQKAAATLADSYQQRRSVSATAQALSKADSLEAAREAFSTISAEAVKMARGHKEYYVVGCSMNQCPAPCVNCQMWRFSDWVQTDATIANPFMGRASPHCGVIR